VASRTFAALFCLCLQTLPAADWADAARRLARQTATSAGARQSIAFSFENRSSASEEDAAAARQALEAELKRAGLSVITSASVEVRAVLAENVREYIWTVETVRGEERAVALAAVARTRQPVTSGRPPLTLKASLLWSQPGRMLDAVRLGAGRMLVLETDKVTVRIEAEPAQASSAVLRLPSPLPRDARGRLEMVGDTWLARLPGAVCSGTLEPLKASCRASEEPWLTPAGPSRMDPQRNFFEGPPPFYAAAAWKGVVVRTGVDRKVYVGGETFLGWGSDIAGIASGCGAGEQVLATLPTIAGVPDAVQAHEFSGAEPVAVTPAVEMAGSVTALWSAGERATAVVFNPKSSQYEAYSLAVRCAP
jgi:hypothetical protein